MKEEALALVAGETDPAKKLNLLREFLQILVLRSLHESEAFVQLSFVGGTALRIVHSLPRFSEDLDFAILHSEGYAPETWLRKLKTDLSLAGFDASVTWNGRSVVQKGWIKVAGLLHEAGLSPMPGQNLSVKLEIDTRPPEGAVTETTIVSRHRMLALRVHDLPSLMAGKIHALLVRPYAKGRDWYDLLWYRGQRPPVAPNLLLLRNALDQTKTAANAQDWHDALKKRLAGLDVQALAGDVAPFLERPDEAELLKPEHIRSILAEVAELPPPETTI